MRVGGYVGVDPASGFPPESEAWLPEEVCRGRIESGVMSPSRRKLLAVLLVALPTTGCLSTSDGAATGTPTATSADETPTATSADETRTRTRTATPAEPIQVALRNGTDDRLTATVTVRRGSTVVAEHTREIPPGGRVAVDAGIGDTGKYRVAVDVADGPTGADTFDIDEYDVENVSTIIVGIQPDSVRFLTEE